MRSVIIVVAHELTQYGCALLLVDDQEGVVEEFAADRLDEAFGDGVGRGAGTGVRMIWTSMAVKNTRC